jgi:hypothetical protein
MMNVSRVICKLQRCSFDTLRIYMRGPTHRSIARPEAFFGAGYHFKMASRAVYASPPQSQDAPDKQLGAQKQPMAKLCTIRGTMAIDDATQITQAIGLAPPVIATVAHFEHNLLR